MKISYLEYFFTYETQLPDGIGFGLFHIGHLVWLFICILLTVCFMCYYIKADSSKRRRAEQILAYSMPAWILLRIIYIIIIHEQLLYELPFHLCSLTGILCALHCVTGWKWTGQVLYTLGLPGTVLALVFPNWAFYPLVHFITIEGFLFHIEIVIYVLAMLYSHKIVPESGKIWQVIAFLALTVAPVYFFDKYFHTNYMFVNWPSEGSPLELLADWWGNPGYLAGYALLVILCILFMYAGHKIIQKLFL